MSDINLLPKDLKEMTIFVNSSTTKETIKKNVRLNRLTKLLRSSNFDKNSVNTNINLTSYDQSNYYKKINQKLNQNLCADSTIPRDRKSNKLDVSTIRDKRDYNQFLEYHMENEGDDLESNNNNINLEENNHGQLNDADNLQSERVNLKLKTVKMSTNSLKQKTEKYVI